MSYNFDSSNEIKNVSTIFLKILFSFAFLIWIADLKVHLRSAYGRDIHIEYFWRQFVSWKYLLHHNYSTIVEKMGWNTKCWHQLLAVIVIDAEKYIYSYLTLILSKIIFSTNVFFWENYCLVRIILHALLCSLRMDWTQLWENL